MQVGISEEDLSMMINEACKACSAPDRAGVDQETYFKIMRSCTLF
jgi:hypothetical protein